MESLNTLSYPGYRRSKDEHNHWKCENGSTCVESKLIDRMHRKFASESNNEGERIHTVVKSCVAYWLSNQSDGADLTAQKIFIRHTGRRR